MEDVFLKDDMQGRQPRGRITRQETVQTGADFVLKCSLLCKKTKCKQIWLVSTEIKVQTGFFKGFLNLFLGFSDFQHLSCSQQIQLQTNPG